MKKQKHHNFNQCLEEFDEMWIRNAFVHIERMDETAFWIGIDPPKPSGLPRIMLNTGVHKGEWYFTLEEDCMAPKYASVRRPRNSKSSLPSGNKVKAAVLAERERCAKISQEWYKERDRSDFTQEQWVSRGTVADEIAARIRSGE